MTNNGLTSRELFLQTLRREQKGRVPFFPRDLTLGMDMLDVATGEVFGNGYDPELSAECVLRLQGYLGSDATVGCIFSYSMESIGGLFKYTEKGIPYASEYPFADPGRIDDHEPSEMTGGIVRGMRRSSEIVRAKRPDLALLTNIPGPVTMAGFARGLETLMMDLISDVPLAEKILDFCTEAAAEEMRFVTKDLSDSVFFASASDNPEMIGEDGFEKYSVRNVKKMTDRAHSDGLLAIFHPHGVFSTDDRHGLLKTALGTGVDGFQFAEGNEPEGIIEVCGDRCAVLGGVTSYTTLLLGPDDRIVRDTDRYLSALEDSYYIMTCSCSLNRGQPLGNLKVMADHIREYNGGRA